MCLWCWGVFGRGHVDCDGVTRSVGSRVFFRRVYVDGFDSAGNKVRVFRVCDVPVSYAETVDYRYGCAGPSAQLCSAGFWVSE